MGFADRVRDLLTGGSGRHQKPAHGARGAQAHGAESGPQASPDQAAWQAAQTPAPGHVGHVTGRADQSAAAAEPVSGPGGPDQRPPGASGQD